MRLPRFAECVALVSIATGLYVARAYVREAEARESAEVELLRTDNRRTIAQSDVRELTRSLLAVRPTSPFLTGIDVSSGTLRVIERDQPVLYVVFSTKCPACARILPFLDTLATSNPDAVVGLSFQDTSAELESYVTGRRLKFAMLQHPDGYLADVLPRHATPVFVVADSDGLRLLKIGLFTDAERAAVRSLVDPDYGA